MSAEIQLELPPLSERPLITFALFAYNQEKYIREAMEGAFAQTYEPLEIILSDDCSADRTFEIMTEMANQYRGPHQIVLRKSPFNVGTALHVQSAFSISKGSLFVVAAGDDISTPSRVADLFTEWNLARRPPGLIHSSRVAFVDGNRNPFKVYTVRDSLMHNNAMTGYAKSEWLPAAAPTCAYTREVFEYFAPLLGGSIIEDAPLMLRAALVGDIIACDKILVQQRLHTANNGTGYNIFSPPRWNRFIQSKMIAFRNMQHDLCSFKGSIDHQLRRTIEKRILSIIKSSSSLLLSETRPLTQIEKLCLGARLIFSPAVGRTFSMRIGFALTFFGFSIHTKLRKRLRKATPKRITND